MEEQDKQLAKLALFQTSRAKLEQRITRFNEIVRQEVIYAYKLGISQTDIANHLGVSKQRIGQITEEYRKNGGA